MATVGEMSGDVAPANRAGPGATETASGSRLSIPRLLWSMVLGIVNTCLRYRVTGLAAEAAFFALLSLPPLVLGVIASLGYFADVVGQATVDRVNATIIDLASTVFTQDIMREVVNPTLAQVPNARADIVSIGFVIALWSGSRALNVYVDTITIMYGLGGRRGIIRTRALSFTLYVVALLLGVIGLPLVLAGPELVADLIPDSLSVLNALYWPVVVLVSVAFLTTLYHLSVPVRTAWLADLPGASLALLIWILGGIALRTTLSAAIGGSSLYGPLTAPIAVLLWLYVTALAVLIGAALNAEIDKRFPAPATWRARRARAERVRRGEVDVPSGASARSVERAGGVVDDDVSAENSVVSPERDG
jgi:membrane protein